MKKLIVTCLLIILLAASVMTVIAMYISGPNIKYTDEMQKEIAVIHQNSNETLLQIERHVFRYVMYIGETEHSYIWFDRDGKQLLQKQKSDIHMEEAILKANDLHALDHVEGHIGYGYENGAYVLENDEYMLLLDIDTMSEIFYQRK